MQDWAEGLSYDPVKSLIDCAYPAIRYYARRDLLGERVEPIQTLWGLPEPKKLLRHQREDGSWTVPPSYSEKYPDVNYPLIETFRRLRELVGKYELDMSHPAVESAAEFVFTAKQGRGIYEVSTSTSMRPTTRGYMSSCSSDRGTAATRASRGRSGGSSR